MSIRNTILGAVLTLTTLVVFAQQSQPAMPAAAKVEVNEGIRVLLTPALETTLASQSAGLVSKVSATLGESVPRGKVLVAFDCDEQVARLKMAKAELASAKENHEAKLRLQGMQQAGEVEVAMAAGAAERARAQVELYQAQTHQCTITAPFSGRVVKVAVKPHQGVTPGQPLLEIISDGPLKLRLNAPANWVRWLKKGTTFEVAIDETGKRYRASVTTINARIDAVSQSIELEATISDKAPELLAGMSGTAHFTLPK